MLPIFTSTFNLVRHAQATVIRPLIHFPSNPRSLAHRRPDRKSHRRPDPLPIDERPLGHFVLKFLGCPRKYAVVCSQSELDPHKLAKKTIKTLQRELRLHEKQNSQKEIYMELTSDPSAKTRRLNCLHHWHCENKNHQSSTKPTLRIEIYLTIVTNLNPSRL